MATVNPSSSIPEIRTDRVINAERPACVHELVAQRAVENPNALAVASAQEELSYVELDRRANRLANYLRSVGVGRNMVVGLYLDRSPAMVVAALAILKAGGAYVPLDPIHPVERLAFMLRDADANLVVSRTHWAEGFPAGAWRMVTFDGDAEKIAAVSDAAPESSVGPDD